MGRGLAKLLASDGCQATSLDLQDRNGDRSAKEMGIQEIRLAPGYSEEDVAREVDVSQFQLVLFAVPVSESQKAGRVIGPMASPGSLLADITSVKSMPLYAMLRSAPEGVSVIGTHPMFGPTVLSNMAGWPVVMVVPPGRCTEEWKARLRHVFESRGAMITVCTDASEHDRIVPVIQGLTHFVCFATLTCLAALRYDIDDARRYHTPPYELLLAFCGRVLAGAVSNPHLYAAIQTEDGVRSIREAYIEAARSFSTAAGQGPDTVRELIYGLATKMPTDFCDWASGVSGEVVQVLGAHRQTIAQAEGSLLGFEHRKTKHFCVGEVVSSTMDSVEIVLLDRGERLNPKMHPRSRSDKRKRTLKLKNYRILQGPLLDAKMHQLATRASRDISVLVPKRVDPRSLASFIEGEPSVEKCEITGTYENAEVPTDYVSVTYRVTAVQWPQPADRRIAEIRQRLKLLGYRLRGDDMLDRGAQDRPRM